VIKRMRQINGRSFKSILTVLVCFSVISMSCPCYADTLDEWTLWPSSPYLGAVFEKYNRPYDPLAFTIVGQDRNFLSWTIIMANSSYDYESSWASVLYLSNLNSDPPEVTSSDSGTSPFYSGTLKYMIHDGHSGYDFSTSSYVGTDDMKDFVIPSYSQEWSSADIVESGVSSVDIIANQTFPWGEEWLNFLTQQSRGPDPKYYIADSGHSAPVLTWTDNYWVSEMEGINNGENFFNYLDSVYSSENWGEAVLFYMTNEGWVHMLGTDTESGYFSEKIATMPLPMMQFSPYYEHFKQEYGYYPRLTLADGMIEAVDIEASPGHWRRVLLGSSGMGSRLIPKSPALEDQVDIWDLETEQDIQYIHGEQPVYAADAHSFGLYALNVAESPDITPSSPELLWSVSNAYWGENEGVIIRNGSIQEHSAITSGNTALYGYKDLKMSLSRPTAGFTEDPSDSSRTWNEVIIGIDRDHDFNAYVIDPNTGGLLADPVFLSSSLDFGDGVLTPYWDTDYEAGFPTRCGAVASNLSGSKYSLQLQNNAQLNEIYIHLSNGKLFQWDIQEWSENGTGPRLVMEMYYQMSLKNAIGNDYKKTALGAASMQDFDATYKRTAINEDSGEAYHRFVAFVVKDGTGEYDEETSLETKDDIRHLVVLDITNILKHYDNNGDLIILDPAAFGRGNQTVILPLTTEQDGSDYRYGWQMYLAGADPSEEKYWNQDIAISSPIFYYDRLILASYEPDTNNSHIYVLPISKEDMDYLASDPGGNRLRKSGNSYYLEEGGTILTYDDTQFAGGAAIDEEGNIYVGTSDGDMVERNLGEFLPSLNASGGSGYVGSGDILYWKVVD